MNPVPTQSWRRLSILEVGIVLLCCGGTLALAVFAERGFNSQARRDFLRSSTFKQVAQMLGQEPERSSMPPGELVINFLTGLAAAGPLVLQGQWLRGRRVGPSFGEWLWVIQATLVAVFFAIPAAHQILAMVCLLPLEFAVLLRSAYLVTSTASPEDEHQCAWSNRVGAAFVCAFSAFFCIYAIVTFSAPLASPYTS